MFWLYFLFDLIDVLVSAARAAAIEDIKGLAQHEKKLALLKKRAIKNVKDKLKNELLSQVPYSRKIYNFGKYITSLKEESAEEGLDKSVFKKAFEHGKENIVETWMDIKQLPEVVKEKLIDIINFNPAAAAEEVLTGKIEDLKKYAKAFNEIINEPEMAKMMNIWLKNTKQFRYGAEYEIKKGKATVFDEHKRNIQPGFNQKDVTPQQVGALVDVSSSWVRAAAFIPIVILSSGVYGLLEMTTKKNPGKLYMWPNTSQEIFQQMINAVGSHGTGAGSVLHNYSMLKKGKAAYLAQASNLVRRAKTHKYKATPLARKFVPRLQKATSARKYYNTQMKMHRPKKG